LRLTRRSDGIKELFDLIDICGQMVGDDFRELANLLGPLVAAITDDADAARGVVVERVTTNDAAGKVFAFCGARSPVQDVQNVVPCDRSRPSAAALWLGI
jgi:hypothetical protein